ncbi:hypothetical protein FI667_g16011, partial [Globisporangium splendens]
MSSYAPSLCGNKRPFSATQTPMLHPMGVDGVNSAAADPTQQKRSPLLCGYPSKKCWSWRVEKRNGELHKFCEYHRQKANTNQRRMEQRRKLNRAPTKGDDTTGEDNTTNASSKVSKDSTTAAAAPSTPTKCPPTINTAMANAEKAAGIRSKKSASSYDCSAASSSPRGIDHFDTVVSLPSASFTWSEVDLDIGMDAAVEYMMIDQNAIDAEPSDKPVDLYEEDLYFLEHFIMEITTSGI